MSHNEANRYLNWLAANSEHDPSELKTYELSVDRSIEHINELSKKFQKPLKFVMSTFYDDEMVDVMTFWDGRPN